ncbi:MAG: carboxypeptidase-like regulatory domain-containing protein [Kofleriaceae bacterium]
MNSQHKRILLVVLLVALGGGGLWWWRRPTASTPAAPTADGSGGGGRSVPTAPVRTRADGNAAAGELAIQIDDDPVGTLQLEGQVVDDAQQPVAGATVAISTNPPRTATTEGDGSFSFDRLVARPYALVARADGGIAGPVTAALTATSDPVILTLRPAAKAQVRVVGDGGAAVAGATVELRGVDLQTGTTGDDGVVGFATVVPGRYDVVAWAPGYAKGYAGAGISGERNDLTVALVRGAPVSGRVVTDTGQPVAGATVSYGGVSEWRTQADPRRDGAITDARGDFRFEALGAGSMRFVARDATHAPGTSEIVTLDGRTPRDGVIVTMAAGARVRGTVVDASGAPVAGARVRLGVATRSIVGEAPRQAYSDAQGRFELAGLPRKPLRAVAMHEAGASATVDVDAQAGDVDDVVLTIDVTGTIAGIVVDPAGEPLEGVQVSAGPAFGRGAMPDMSQWRLRGFPEALTDGGGRFTLTGLAPGTYQVRAARSRIGRRGPRGGPGDGVEASAGDRDVRLVLAPEGSVTGKVAFADGRVPDLMTVSVGFTSEAVASPDGRFTLDGLAPGELEVTVRGPSFERRSVTATVVSAKVTDVGTITVSRGRSLAGVVVAAGAPVAGATVYAGRQIFGSGSSSQAGGGGGPPMARGTKDTTTDADGRFTLSGYGGGDLTIVAEHPEHGRSRALRLGSDDPSQGNLELALEPFGALRGTLRQNGAPAEGVIVTCQSVTSPGASYAVASGPDGGYRFDRLAPDTYKVSAMVGGNPMMGMKFYSQEVTVASGQEVVVELTVTPGQVALEARAQATDGEVGLVSMWIASGVLAVASARELEQRLAAAGGGTSQWRVAMAGGAVTFDELVPGGYTVCAVPFPREIQGMAAMGYVELHGDELPAFCQQVTVAPAPATQQVAVTVVPPALIVDP